MKKNILILISYITLVSCGGLTDVGKVLRNEKITTTDEFLVKKRDPLVLPPDYKNIPQPGKKKQQGSKWSKNKKNPYHRRRS